MLLYQYTIMLGGDHVTNPPALLDFNQNHKFSLFAVTVGRNSPGLDLNFKFLQLCFGRNAPDKPGFLGEQNSQGAYSHGRHFLWVISFLAKKSGY